MPAGPVDVPGELSRFGEAEEEILKTFSSLTQKAQSGEITEAVLAAEIERQVLPQWRTAGERIVALKEVPPEQQSVVSKVTDYIHAREEAWVLLVQAIQQNDATKGEQFRRKWAAAEEIVRQLKTKNQDQQGKGRRP